MDANDPRHGTNRGASQHSRDGEPPCDACRAAKSRYNKGRMLDAERGTAREVQLGEAAFAIVRRSPPGYLSELTGVSRCRLEEYRHGDAGQYVYRSSRDKILAAAPYAYWSYIGIQRRVQALITLGWTARTIGNQMGVAERSVVRITKAGTHLLRVKQEVSLKALPVYDELSMSFPPETTPHERMAATKSRNLATRNGWAPPLAWDDIDDPDAKPDLGKTFHAFDLARHDQLDPVVVERLLDGHTVRATQAERREAMRRWTTAGNSKRSLERMHGWKDGRYDARAS